MISIRIFAVVASLLIVSTMAMPLARITHHLHDKDLHKRVAPTLAERLSTAFEAFDQVLGHVGPQQAMADKFAEQYPTIVTDFTRQVRGIYAKDPKFDATILENLYFDSVVLFMTRVTADYAALIAAFTLDAQFMVTDVKMFSNDPHHKQRRVIIFTTTGGKKVVYKPATQDASFFFTSNAPESFLTMYNQWIPKYKLYTYPVMRKSDGDGKYGYIDFISQDTNVVDKNELTGYSYRAGLMVAAQVVCGVTDMHIENMMTHRVGPGDLQAVVVDAETMFTPMTDFVVSNVGVFNGKGAFWNHDVHQDASFNGDKNSVITFNGVTGHPPDPTKFMQGFTDGFKCMGAHKNDILNWVNNVVEDASYYRFVPTSTNNFRSLNWAYLVEPVFDCKKMTKYFGSMINTDYKWRYIGLMRDNCDVIKDDLLETDDVPAIWLRHGNAKIYFPDLTTELSLAGLDYAGSTDEGFFDGKIATYGDTANTDLLEQTLLSISVARINMAVQADGSIPAYILDPLEDDVERINDLIKTFEYTS